MSLNASSPSCSHSDRYLVTLTFCSVKLVVVVPLSAFVLRLGLQQWRSVKTSTHSEVLCFLISTSELFWCPGFIFFLLGLHFDHDWLRKLASCTFNLTFYGEFVFHSLTCVDWYLAVVHPLFYVRLKNARWVKIKRLGLVLACLLIIGGSLIDLTNLPFAALSMMFISFSFFLLVITFCAAYVLCALIRPGPGHGNGGGDKAYVDQLKQKAFHTVMVISCVLWSSFAGLLITTATTRSSLVGWDVRCLLSEGLMWFTFPSSLVSPLLYLYKDGKLSLSLCCNK